MTEGKIEFVWEVYVSPTVCVLVVDYDAPDQAEWIQRAKEQGIALPIL